MRVLFAIAHLDKGGGQAVQAAQLFRRLAPFVDGTMVCLRSPGAPPGSSEGDGIVEVGTLRFPQGIAELARAIRQRRSEFDLVQAFDQYYALPASRLARARPLVVRLGAHPSEDLGSRYGAAGRLATGLVNPWLFSETAVVVNARHLLTALPHQRPTFIPNGVDVDRFPATRDREAARRELGLPADVPLLGFTGKIIPRKNIEELYAVVRALPDVHLLLVGGDHEPYYGDGYHRAIRRTFEDVLPRVHFAGEVASDRIPDYLAAMDLFVFPSLLEGMPNSVLEAMAAGVPVVARDQAAHRDLLASGGGRLYGSPAELAETVRGLLADPGELRRMGEAGRSLVRREYSFGAAVRAYLRLYHAVLDAARH